MNRTTNTPQGQSVNPAAATNYQAEAIDRLSSRSTKIAWGIAALLSAWLMIYPLVGGLVVVNDDLKFLRGELNVGSVEENLRWSWLHSSSFRPLEIIVARFCDEQSLACWPVVPVQFCGLAVVLMGIVALSRRVLPSWPIAAPLIALWILLSPSTMTSLWQMDTCSQTWGAALGLWCGILCWDIVVLARADAPIGINVLFLLALASIGMCIKETFFGWSAAISGGLIVAMSDLGRGACRSSWRSKWRMAMALFPIAAVPLVFLGLRWAWGGLGGVQSLEVDPEARYQVGLGDNLVANFITSAFGMISNGPLHLFNDVFAMLPLRALPVLSGLAGCALIIAAGALRVFRRKSASSIPLRPVLLCAGVCIFSIVVTLPLGSVSDLYGFGPNIGTGLLVVTSILMMWNLIDNNGRMIARAFTVVATVLIATVGLYGVASRSYQFSMTWRYTSELNRIVLTHLNALPPYRPGDPVPYIYFAPPCYTGNTYGQIMIPPLHSLNLIWMKPWLARAHPRHPLHIVFEPQSTVRPGLDLVVDCSDFPQREDW